MKTYYTVYKVTNKISGKFYIGTHKTKNLEDGYYGSGKYLKRAIEKHGIENFDKEILFVYDNPEDMFAKEAEIINEDFLAEENTYNLKIGGMGGFDFINQNELASGRTKLTKEQADRGRQTQSYLFKNDEKYRKRYSRKRRIVYNSVPEMNWMGRKHTEETKEKMRQSAKQRTGQRNSQYGTM